MKNLKAVAAVLCAGAVFAAAFTFSGCKNGESGVINGDYKEATSAEFTNAVEAIDTENLFTPAENAEKFGYEFHTETSGKASYGGGNLGDAFEASAKADAEVKFILAKTDGNGLNVNGAGKLNFELLTNISKLGNNTLSAGFYADNSNLYLDASIKSTVSGAEQSSAFKYKIPYDAIKDLINGIIGGTTPSAEGSISGGFSLAEFAEIAVNLGFKTYIDFNNGIKLKLTADKEAIANLLWNIDSDIFYSTALSDSSKLEIYFSIDKAGKFAGFAANYNIYTEVTVADSDTVTASLNGATSLKVYNGTIKLPANLDEYYEIPDFGGATVPTYLAY